ncbi:MAG TPA: histidine decarboxylase, pyruvoyl type [Patescibacteria group bacterium]|nr:histidine decarboxylase, pyruvoyl type [Patescibacteria group bacterium]
MPNAVSEDPYVSRLDDRCQGVRDPNRYLVAMNVAAAKVPMRFGTAGSKTLDFIAAFDLAEVTEAHLGQINLIEVSSFCGPEGLIWGLDVAAHESLRDRKLFDIRLWNGKAVPVFDGEPLVAAAKALFGEGTGRRFPLAPGTLCPTASKNISAQGPAVLYAAFAIGIRADGACASVLMEDVGTLADGSEVSRAAAVRHVGESVAAIAANQRTDYREIFVAFRAVEVGAGEAGCAITMLPYFTIARKALPEGGLAAAAHMTLGAWSSAVTT